MSVTVETGRLNEILVMLEQRWPQTFSAYEARRRPIKVGIAADLRAALAGEVTPIELSIVLRRYVTNVVYLSRMREGAARIGLDGEVAGHVTRDQAAMAAEESQRRAKKKAAAEPRAPVSEAPRADVSVSDAPVKARASLADLKAAALARRRASSVAA